MLVQHRLDLGRIDVEAGADDQFFGAADDVEDVAVEAREIAGVEPAIGVNHRCSRLRGPVIAAHDGQGVDREERVVPVASDPMALDEARRLEALVIGLVLDAGEALRGGPVARRRGDDPGGALVGDRVNHGH